jgi:hypothetical protein
VASKQLSFAWISPTVSGSDTPTLDYDVAEEIRAAAKLGARTQDLAAAYGVRDCTISKILHRRTYKAPKAEPMLGPKPPPPNLTEARWGMSEAVAAVRAGETLRRVAMRHGVKELTLKKWLKGTT